VFDEWPLAAATAERYPNVDHVPIPTGGLSILDGLERNVALWERPIPNLCNQAWVDRISAEAKHRGLTLMLTGTMGNLSFSNAGLELLPELLVSGRLFRLAAAIRAVKRQSGGRWAGVGLQTVAPFLPGPLWTQVNRLRGLGRDSEVITFATPKAEAAAQPQRPEDLCGVDPYGRPPANGRKARMAALTRIDPGPFNKGTLAGWGVDVRDPSADRALFEFALSVPTEEYIVAGMNRALARQGFADRLPEKVRLEMRKGFQASDWAAALRAERERLRAEAESIAASPAASEVVDAGKMLRVIDAWPEGSLNDPVVHGTYRLSLLRALAAGHFLRWADTSVAAEDADF
jgi:asparagine synthase (glutamine-hydrolysing)